MAFGTNYTINLTVQSKHDALLYLNKFGYNPCMDSKVTLCSLSLSSMIKDFQQRFQLKVTGTLDEATIKQMNRPRCGNKDPPLRSSKSDVKSLVQKWSRSTLTWSLRNHSPRIDAAQTESIINQAFGAWFQHIPLTIRQVCSSCSANIIIDFGWAHHGDHYPFDGPGGTLAHAYSPEDGRIHFDMEEPWTSTYEDFNINLYIVAVHEIGHALGLEHEYNKGSIMFPSYQLMKKKNILPQIDRMLIQRLYGTVSKATTQPTTTKMKTTTTTTTKMKTTTATTKMKTTTTTKMKTTITPRTITTTTKLKVTTQSTITNLPHNKQNCRLFIDAAFDFPDGTFHLLDTGMLKRYFPHKQSWDAHVVPFRRMYSYLPNRVSGGVYDFAHNEVLIFTNARVYRYKVRLRSYQIVYYRDDPLPDHLENSIVGAIYYQDGVHVIKAKSLQPFDVDKFEKKTIETKLSKEFLGFNGSVRSAFTSGYLHHFFTSDRLLYVWDEQFDRWKTFAKPMETNWFACMKKM